MSTSTWTTTTSATGLPTLEPQPVIKRRATSFRGIQDFSPSHSPTRLNQEEPRNYHLSQRGANRYNLNERGVNPPYLRSPTKSSDSLGNAKVSDFNTDFKRNRTGKIFRRNTFLTQLKEDSVEGGKAPEKELRRNSYDESRAARSSNINSISRSSQPRDSSESRNFKENILSSSRQSKLSVVNTSSDSENADPSTATTEDRVKQSVLPQNKTDTEDVSISDRVIQNKSPTSNKSTQKRDHQVVLLGDKVESSLLPSEPEASSELVKDEWDSQTIFTLDDGTVYNLDHLSDNHLLNTLSDWDYPIFDLAESSGPNLLSHLSYRVFYEIGLFQTFKLPLREFLNFFHNLEMGYRDIPYHNQIHAADVLHAVYYFTTQPIPGFSPPPEAALAALQHAVLGKGKFLLKPSPMARFLGVYQFPCVPVPRTRGYIFENLLRKLREGGSVSQNPCRIFHCQESYGILGENIPALELMALYTASAMHDYDHPGRTNAFLVTTNAPQAVLYNDRSVLENHHAASAWSLFLSKPEFNFLVHLGKAEFKRFRYLVIEFILATDLKRHFELIAEFNAKANELSGPGIDWNSESDRLLVLQMTIKLSDINGPCKESELHRSWTNRIAEEFYDQGEEEKKLGLPVSPYMDRSNPQLPKLQESFINHLVAPLCNAYSEAGLLPGMWQEGSTVESIKEESDSNDEDDESSGSEEVVQKAKFKLKKIICQLPRHIEENHQYWVNKIKEEHLHSDEVSPQQLSPQDDAVLFQKTENLPPSFPEDQSDLVTQFTSECVMESIDEEKTPAGVSNSPSFSFVSSDTVQKVTSQIVKASGALMICLRENVRRGHILSKNVVPELEV